MPGKDANAVKENTNVTEVMFEKIEIIMTGEDTNVSSPAK